MTLLRRNWIRDVASAGAGALLIPNTVCVATEPSKPVVVDTHLHCFAGSRDARFPYHSRAPYRPDATASPEHLLKCMDGAGVHHAVVVHPEPYQDDHRYLEHCLDVGGARLKGTCLFFSDRPKSLARMPEFLKRNVGRIIAARVHAYAPGRLPPFGSKELRRLWKIAADHQLAIQLHFEPRYAAKLAPLVKEFRQVRTIIDHMGRPMQGTSEEHEEVLRWADLPNTILKVSAIPDQNKYPHRDIKPILKRLSSAYGADRMIYGGGFNAVATPSTYRAYRENVERLLGHLPVGERNKILGQNAARLFFS